MFRILLSVGPQRFLDQRNVPFLRWSKILGSLTLDLLKLQLIAIPIGHNAPIQG